MKRFLQLKIKTKIFYLLIFIFFSLIFLAHYEIVGQAVYGDGIEYYAWMHSVYFDHDLNFENESHHIYNNEYNNNFPNIKGPQVVFVKTQSGKIGNYHPPGMAILLLPFYFLADIFVIVLNFLGSHSLRNGYSNVYQITVGLGAVFYGVLGLFTVEKLLNVIFLKNNKKFAKLAVFAILFTSPLFYYLSIDVLNSHFADFFITAVFFYVLLKHKVDYKFSLLLGFLIGLAALVRTQEGALFIPFLIALIWQSLKTKKIFKSVICFLITFVTFLAIFSPLLFAWNYLYGKVTNQDYVSNFLFNGFSLNLFGSLFDFKNGLFIKSPFLFLLLFFIPFAFKKVKKEFLIFFSYFVIQFLIIYKYGGWVAASFGGRMYISSFFLFFLLAILFFQKINRKICTAILIFFVMLNFVLIFNFMLFSKEASGGKKGVENYTKTRIENIFKSF